MVFSRARNALILKPYERVYLGVCDLPSTESPALRAMTRSAENATRRRKLVLRPGEYALAMLAHPSWHFRRRDCAGARYPGRTVLALDVKRRANASG